MAPAQRPEHPDHPTARRPRLPAPRAPRTKLRPTPTLLLRALGLVNPTIRELVEMQYQFEEPFIVDSSKIATKLGVHATPITEALELTLATYRAGPE